MVAVVPLIMMGIETTLRRSCPQSPPAALLLAVAGGSALLRPAPPWVLLRCRRRSSRHGQQGPVNPSHRLFRSRLDHAYSSTMNFRTKSLLLATTCQSIPFQLGGGGGE